MKIISHFRLRRSRATRERNRVIAAAFCVMTFFHATLLSARAAPAPEYFRDAALKAWFGYPPHPGSEPLLVTHFYGEEEKPDWISEAFLVRLNDSGETEFWDWPDENGAVSSFSLPAPAGWSQWLVADIKGIARDNAKGRESYLPSRLWHLWLPESSELAAQKKTP